MRPNQPVSLGAVIKSIAEANYDEVSRICYPLFKNTPIKYFDYTRYYDSGEIVSCGTTAPDVVQRYCTDDLLPSFEEFKVFGMFGIKMTYVSHSMPLPPGINEINPDKMNGNISCAADLKIFHRLYFIERYMDFYVSYGFGVNKESASIFNFYLNAVGLLEDFAKYFEHHASDLIENASHECRVINPHYFKKSISLNENIGALCDISKLDFKVEPLRANVIDGKLITEREMECLALVSRGYTMKNTARKLEISHRTVEQHLRNIKDKLGLSTKNQLVEVWHANEVVKDEC